MYPNEKYTNTGELEDMLDYYFDDLYYNEDKIDDHLNHKPNKLTVKGALSMKESFYKEYGVRTEAKQIFNINCFKQISIQDPFPAETEKDVLPFVPPEKIHGHYDHNEASLVLNETRYVFEYSP